MPQAILVPVISDGRSLADQAHSNDVLGGLPPMLELLPSRFREFLTRHSGLPDLVEIVLDLGRKRQSKKLQEALHNGIEFHCVKHNTVSQVKSFLRRYFQLELREVDAQN